MKNKLNLRFHNICKILRKCRSKYTLKFFKRIKAANEVSLNNKDEVSLNNKFYFSTSIVSNNLNIVWHKAINHRNNKFVWIRRDDFPKEDESFYLMILHDLDKGDCLISSCFNYFRSRKDFYSKYTFVKKVKQIKNKATQ